MAFIKKNLYLLAGLFLLVEWVTVQVSPALLGYLSLLSFVFPIAFLLNLFIVAQAGLRRRRLGLVNFAVVVLCFPVMSSFYSLHFTGQWPEGDLKILSFNAHYFDVTDLKDEPVSVRIQQQDKMLAFIIKTDADVLCLQEFSGDNHATTKRALDRLMLAGYKHHGRGWGSLMILSRYPISHQYYHVFPKTYNSYNYADIEFKGSTIRVFNFHLQSIKMGADADVIAHTPNAEYIKNNKKTYLTAFKKIAKAQQRRAEQVEKLKNELEATPYPYVVCGDLNDTPFSYAYQYLSTNLSDAYTSCRWGVGTTYRGKLPLLRIDYQFCNKDLMFHTLKVFDKDFSDHKPLLSSLSLK